MDKCIVLIRVSTVLQELKSQSDAVIAEAVRHGFSKENIYIIEDKESAIKLSEAERNGLNEMKQLIENDPDIRCVFAWELTRISRIQKDLFSIRDYLVQRHIQLIICKPYMELLDADGNITQTSSLLFSLFASMAESEMMIKKERFSRAKAYNKKEGKLTEGIPLFGYALDSDKRYIPHPEQSKLVKRIYEKYADEGYSMVTLGNELMSQGVFKCKSAIQKVKRILAEEKYTGIFPYPEIVSKNLYDKVKAKRQAAYNMPKQAGKKYLCRGLIYVDGYLLSPKSYEGHNNSVYAAKQGHISMTIADSIVWQIGMEYHKRFVHNKDIIEKQLVHDIQLYTRKLFTANEEAKKLQEQIDAVEERLIYGKISKAKAEQIENNLDKEIKKNKDDARDFQLRLDNLNKAFYDNQRGKQYDYTALGLEDEIKIVNDVFYRIVMERQSLSICKLMFYSKYTDEILELTVNTRRLIDNNIISREIKNGELN